MKHRAETLETMRRSLREAGIKLTHQRLEIISEVAYFSGHPSVSDVFNAVRERVPTISLDTVYRTMKTLSELGLIHPVGYSSDGVRFDADRAPHHHFLCSLCGEAYDFTCAELDAIPIPRQAMEIGTVRGSRIEIRGICRDCLGKKED